MTKHGPMLFFAFFLTSLFALKSFSTVTPAGLKLEFVNLAKTVQTNVSSPSKVYGIYAEGGVKTKDTCYQVYNQLEVLLSAGPTAVLQKMENDFWGLIYVNCPGDPNFNSPTSIQISVYAQANSYIGGRQLERRMKKLKGYVFAGVSFDVTAGERLAVQRILAFTAGGTTFTLESNPYIATLKKILIGFDQELKLIQADKFKFLWEFYGDFFNKDTLQPFIQKFSPIASSLDSYNNVYLDKISEWPLFQRIYAVDCRDPKVGCFNQPFRTGINLKQYTKNRIPHRQ